MARRGILEASLERTLSSDGTEAEESVTEAEAPAHPSNLRSGSPNVRRFQETFDHLRSQAVQEIVTDRIAEGRFTDRFDPADEIDGLAASIRESGQQLPVLLRRAPEGSTGEFEPVYGRRRIAACAHLGIPVRAHVGNLDDEALIVAQGLENAERLESSYIEKASFIVQLREAGVRPQVIERSLGIQGPEVSRMTAVIRDLPPALVTAIGPAHGIGRRQWVELAGTTKTLDTVRIQPVIEEIAELQGSADRFNRATKRLKASGSGSRVTAETNSLAGGRLLVIHRQSRVEIRVADKDDRAFIDWLTRHGEDLFLQWKDGRTTSKD